MTDKDLRREKIEKLKKSAKRYGVSMNQLYERYVNSCFDFQHDADIDAAISRLKKSAQHGRMNISEADICGLFDTLGELCKEKGLGVVFVPEIAGMIGDKRLGHMVRELSIRLDESLETNN